MKSLSLLSVITLIYTSLVVPIVNDIFYPVGDMNAYNSESIYVYNITDDRLICAKNARKKRAPASLVKIMTAGVVLEQIDDLSASAPIDEASYLRAVEHNLAMAGFYSYERTTYNDLLYGALLASGGECANSLAINAAGDITTFVRLMNDRASMLCLKNTVYQTVDGIDAEGQYTTAEDVGKLLIESLKNDEFKKIFTSKNYLSTRTLSHPDGIMINSTVFLKLKDYVFYDFDIIGGKSGTTDDAGLCWATLGEKNGKEYIVVVMGVPYENINDTGAGHIEDVIKILELL